MTFRERFHFIKYVPETVRFRLSEYGLKYVGFYCWKLTDIDFCTIICLKVRGFFGCILGCDGFDDKGFHIFLGLKTWLLEPFTNRRNHVICSFKITFPVSIFGCKWMVSLCYTLIAIDVMQYWILQCFSFSRQPALFNNVNGADIVSDNLD